jgi:hypothetical protein
MEEPSLLQLSPNFIVNIILRLLEYDAVGFGRKVPTFRRREAARSSEAFVLIYRMIRRDIPGDSNHHGYRYDNLKSKKVFNIILISVINKKLKGINKNKKEISKETVLRG